MSGSIQMINLSHFNPQQMDFIISFNYICVFVVMSVVGVKNIIDKQFSFSINCFGWLMNPNKQILAVRLHVPLLLI